MTMYMFMYILIASFVCLRTGSTCSCTVLVGQLWWISGDCRLLPLLQGECTGSMNYSITCTMSCSSHSPSLPPSLPTHNICSNSNMLQAGLVTALTLSTSRIPPLVMTLTCTSVTHNGLLHCSSLCTCYIL